jgi:protein-tyrosine phosphatase
MIDLHTHVLPGLDDGAATLDESLAMARIATADGVSVLAATPHLDPESGDARPDDSALLGELHRAIASAGMSIEIVRGCEAYLSTRLPEMVAAGSVPTLNGSRYLLVEWPLQSVAAFGDNVVFSLQLRGITPIFAHAERCVMVQRDVAAVASLVDRGVLVQVNAGSLQGSFGPAAKRTAEVLLRRNLVHILASDAHSPHDRPPILSDAVRRVAAIVGEPAAAAMVTTNPRAVLEDRTVDVNRPVEQRTRPFWAVWR